MQLGVGAVVWERLSTPIKSRRTNHKEEGVKTQGRKKQWVKWGGYWHLWWDILWVAAGVVGLQLKKASTILMRSTHTLLIFHPRGMMTVDCLVMSIGWGLEAVTRVHEETEDLVQGLERQR